MSCVVCADAGRVKRMSNNPTMEADILRMGEIASLRFRGLNQSRNLWRSYMVRIPRGQGD
jgi:hypothetical protein